MHGIGELLVGNGTLVDEHVLLQYLVGLFYVPLDVVHHFLLEALKGVFLWKLV